MPPENDAKPAYEQAAFAGALLRKGAALSGMTDGRGRAAADRFRVYRNNVIASLAQALEASFPTTRRLVGETFFRAAAVAYAEEEKPASPLLFRYGTTFPDFLATLPGLASFPFVPEAARIEYARLQSLNAADADPLPADALARLKPETLPAAVLEPHPATRLVATPAGGLSAWRTNQDPPLPTVEAAAALVTRPAMEVTVTPLSAAAANFASALMDGRPLGEAAAVEGLDLPPAIAALISSGAFRSLRVTETS